ncbi:hypothetical protein ACFFNY_13210 [Paenibacillus hodogayensis]|uniref:DUF3618 domain-containing protein n=1 Tax=Paenibacillus hodogayensis TaxID=279208 RepID=A0ABV5VWA8_9BACL
MSDKGGQRGEEEKRAGTNGETGSREKEARPSVPAAESAGIPSSGETSEAVRESGDAALRERLREELEPLRFDAVEQVVRRTHPRTFGQRLRAWWNKELEIPVVPGGAAVAMVLFLFGIQQAASPHKRNEAAAGTRQLVEAGGSMYWKDQLEKAVPSAEKPPTSAGDEDESAVREGGWSERGIARAGMEIENKG